MTLIREETKPRLRETIFDSQSELWVYQGLLKNWGGRVCAHIPVWSVMDIGTLGLPERQQLYLSQTAFDFVIISAEQASYGKPLIALEFDGMGWGYSNGQQYVQGVSTEDPYRKLKLDRKIEACRLCGFPLVVVSWPELRPMGARPLRLLDGIIGAVLTRQELWKTLRETKPLPTRPKEFADQVGLMKLEAELANNPLTAALAELRSKLGGSYSFLEAETTETKEMYTHTSKAKVGEQVFEETVWLRQVACDGLWLPELAKNAADLGVLMKVENACS